MSVEDSESRRFELNGWLSFSQADLDPTSAQELFFFAFFWKFGTLFLKICAHSERYRNLIAGIFEIKTFWQHRVSTVIGLRDVVAQGPSKCRRIKNVDGYFFCRACSCSGGRPTKQGLSLSKQTAMYYDHATEQAVKGACTADSPP